MGAERRKFKVYLRGAAKLRYTPQIPYKYYQQGIGEHSAIKKTQLFDMDSNSFFDFSRIRVPLIKS